MRAWVAWIKAGEQHDTEGDRKKPRGLKNLATDPRRP